MTPLTSFVLLLAAHEILDVREFRNDWPDMPRRVRELSDAPYTDAVHLFTMTRAACSEGRQINRAYGARLRAIRELYSDAQHVATAIRVNGEIYDAYDALGDATVSFYYVHIRRRALLRLRNLLGDADFYAGRLPLPVPTWGNP